MKRSGGDVGRFAMLGSQGRVSPPPMVPSRQSPRRSPSHRRNDSAEFHRMAVQLSIRADTRFGEEVFVCGEVSELGAWDEAKALKLSTDDANFPVWRVAVEMLWMKPTIAYKYLIKNADGVVRWEAFEGNRTLEAADAREKDDGDFDTPNEIDVCSSETSSLAATDEQLLTRGGLLEKERVLIVCYRLPLIATRHDGSWTFRQDDGVGSPRWSAAKLGEKVEVVYIGWLGVDVPEDEKDEIAERLLRDYKCFPVFCSDKLVQSFYFGFTLTVLHPKFHGHSTLSTSATMFEDWPSYRAANQLWGDTVLRCFNDNDIVWVYGYPLMLVPLLLGRHLQKAHGSPIIFSCDLPWPSSEVFLTLPMREQLLRGVLASDLVHFHNFRYTRNMVSTAQRLLGMQFSASRGGYVSINYHGRQVMLRSSHVGIEASSYSERLCSSEVAQAYEQWRSIVGDDRTLFIGIDNVGVRTYTFSGVLNKLQAYRELLRKEPQMASRTALVQIVVPVGMQAGFDGPSDKVISEITELASSIRAEFDNCVCHIQQMAPPKMEGNIYRDATVLALFQRGDAFLSTAFHGRMQMRPLQFVLCSTERSGVLILSEFNSCCHIDGVLLVHPLNVKSIVVKLRHVVLMDTTERKQLHSRLLHSATKNPPEPWALSILRDARFSVGEGTQNGLVGMGLGLSFRVLDFGSHFQHLDMDGVVARYRASTGQRVILCAYEGIFMPILERHSTSMPLDSALSSLWKSIASHPNNTVIIYSIREKMVLEAAFQDNNQIGLLAEQGMYIRWPETRMWEAQADDVDLQWKESCKRIMEEYTDRIDGTYISDRDAVLTWEYQKADQSFARIQGNELAMHLEDILSGFDVEVIHTASIVEVKPSGISKGSATAKILREVVSSKGRIDMIVAMGEDRTDEQIFIELHNNPFITPECKLYTVMMGCNPSDADFFVNDTEEARELLTRLSR